MTSETDESTFLYFNFIIINVRFINNLFILEIIYLFIHLFIPLIYFYIRKIENVIEINVKLLGAAHTPKRIHSDNS